MTLDFELEQEVETTSPTSPLTLWLVDDHAVYRRLLAEQFSRGAHSIFCERQFSSAEALLSALASGPPPDAILSDVQMGGISGVDAVARIKAIAPQTRVILLTTFYDSAGAVKALRDGAEAYLVKRVPFAMILQHLREPGNARVESRIGWPITEPSPAERVGAPAEHTRNFWSQCRAWARLLPAAARWWRTVSALPKS